MDHEHAAQPSLAGCAESLIEDVQLLAMTTEWIDACPLGTAAGYGVNVPLPRSTVSVSSSTTTRPRLITRRGQPLTCRPS